MGKWRYDEHGWLQAEGQDESIEGINEAMRFHNADIDALRAELARVKAESLRVVVDGEAPAKSIPMAAHFEYGRVVYRMFYGDIDKDEMKATDILSSKKIVLSCKTSVRRVRLERWEDE